mmetsp:Transcript_22531/g.31376  ORF Transcript_22531/g.31376 Transcript_22531/m.31376 type:complete len:247 (-) Transcript_22531:989-1729(-)
MTSSIALVSQEKVPLSLQVAFGGSFFVPFYCSCAILLDAKPMLVTEPKIVLCFSDFSVLYSGFKPPIRLSEVLLDSVSSQETFGKGILSCSELVLRGTSIHLESFSILVFEFIVPSQSVLSSRRILGRSPLVPCDSLPQVCRYANSIFVANSKTVQGSSRRSISSLFVPFDGFLRIFWHTKSIFIAPTKAALGTGRLGFSSFFVPLHSTIKLFLFLKAPAKSNLSKHSIIVFCSLAYPFDGFIDVT